MYFYYSHALEIPYAGLYGPIIQTYSGLDYLHW